MISLIIDVRVPTTGRANAKARKQKGICRVAAVLGALNIRVIAAKATGFHDRVDCAARIRRMVEVQSMSKLMS